MRVFIWLMSLLILASGETYAESVPAAQAPVRYIEFLLTDGTRLTGKIHRETPDKVIAISSLGVRFEIPRHLIVSRRPAPPDFGRRRLEQTDPNYSRLLLAPTGRPLRVGEGYLSDHYVVFPGLAYGVTPHLSVMAGLSVLPGLALGDQLKYFVPRMGWRIGDDLSVSVGAALVAAEADGDGGSAGLGFTIATLGDADRSLTLGLGAGWRDEVQRDAEVMDGPMILFGGSYRLTDTMALVSENWLITGAGVSLSEQPFGLALRFFGERISADLGVILIGDALSDGIPIPWLSFSYHFSKSG